MLSKKSKYAIKALVRLARNFEDNHPLKISDISNEEGIPKKFLEAILVELRNNGLVRSKMGAGGGYYLAKPPSEIMLSNVIRISGGPIAMLPCVSLNFYESCEECKDEAKCGLRNVMMDVRIATLEILANTSLLDVIKREDQIS